MLFSPQGAHKGADNSKMQKNEYLKAFAGMRNPAAKGKPPFDTCMALEAYIVYRTAQCITPGLFVF